ncbi:MAG: cob(I)yrinic acid a,c-diamide adenosyltransferase [Myxococcales bacterium]|nr:cob(I)yrinic acid a,c-diamide adenosyltransferase [Myxococcales bacterium]
MKIYTRTGDDGTTGLFGGVRVPKADPRVEAYGTVDEANSVLGLARAAGVSGALDESLARIQTELFTLGAELACAPGKEDKLGLEPVGDAHIERLEAEIDALEAGLEPLKNFILPGGCMPAAFLHQARCVCRRAERRVLEARQSTPVREPLVRYLNRLSDLLFVQARAANHQAGQVDVPWTPRAKAD